MIRFALAWPEALVIHKSTLESLELIAADRRFLNIGGSVGFETNGVCPENIGLAPPRLTLEIINDQSQFQPGQAQISQHWRLKDRMPLQSRFVVHHDRIFHLHTRAQRFAQDLAFVSDANRQLPLNTDVAQTKFLFQGFFPIATSEI